MSLTVWREITTALFLPTKGQPWPSPSLTFHEGGGDAKYWLGHSLLFCYNKSLQTLQLETTKCIISQSYRSEVLVPWAGSVFRVSPWVIAQSKLFVITYRETLGWICLQAQADCLQNQNPGKADMVLEEASFVPRSLPCILASLRQSAAMAPLHPRATEPQWCTKLFPDFESLWCSPLMHLSVFLFCLPPAWQCSCDYTGTT